MKLTKIFQIRGMTNSQKTSEKGQALLLVLVLLLVGAIIVTSSLSFVGTSLKTNKVYIANTTSLYAAEAGIQDGIWQILNQTSSDLNLILDPISPNTNAFTDYDYNSSGWTYTLSSPTTNNAVNVNTYPVNISVTNVWVPLIDDNNPSFVPSITNPLPPDGKDYFDPPSPSTAQNISQNTILLVSGEVITWSSSGGNYKIKVNYNDTIPSKPLTITSIGCWLPQGFAYTNGSSNLQGIYSTEQVLQCAGNEAVVWTLPSGTTFSSLRSSLGQTGSTIAISLLYTANLAKMPEPLPWITNTANLNFIYSYAWDADVKVYDMIASAWKTEIEAYIPKSATRSIGSAVSGDYVAIGNSLMTMGTYNSNGIRYSAVTYPNTTSATVPVDSSKSGSDIEGAYLYWSGWLQSSSEHLGVNPGTDYGTLVNLFINGHQVCFNGSNYTQGTNPVESSKNQTQSIDVTGNGDYSYSCYKDVTTLVRGELQAESASIFSNTLTFNVGPANGCTLGNTDNEWSYAGWSLVLIYSGPTTLGHQLYLYDTFTYADGNHGNPGNGADIDPTQNTSGPGGTISGFLVPSQIPGEGSADSAAKLTVFVGEGDWCYAGDFIALNIPSAYWTNPWSLPANSPYRLWDGIATNGNSASNPNNVWNSYPQTGTGLVDGVDIKTFNITWGSGLVNAGDTSARIDMPTQTDSWNLIYMILSFRSSVTSGGSVSYLIRRKP